MNVKALLPAAVMAVVMVTGTACASNPDHERTVSEVMTDAGITTRVKTALLTEDDVKSFDIKVETFNGVVQLSGFVDSQWQIDKAAQVARGVSGVRRVQNDLIHKPN